MDSSLKEPLWNQFGAAIDMFENAIIACPDNLWDTDSNFWYIGYHTLFYLDYYLSEEPVKFLPPEPYTLSEFDSDGIMPDRVYNKTELVSYIKHCREKCRNLIANSTPENLAARWINKYKNYSMFEMHLYNIRHVQHHTGQLNLLLGKIDHNLPIWVSQTKLNL